MNQEQLDQIQIQIEQDSIKYKCDLCPMKFQQYRSYMSHSVSVHNKKQYQCKYCPRKYFNINILSGHVANHIIKHSIKNNKHSKAEITRILKKIKYDNKKQYSPLSMYRCKYCKLSLLTFRSLNKHEIHCY